MHVRQKVNQSKIIQEKGIYIEEKGQEEGRRFVFHGVLIVVPARILHGASGTHKKDGICVILRLLSMCHCIVGHRESLQTAKCLSL
jgi:hypothetical protein